MPPPSLPPPHLTHTTTYSHSPAPLPPCPPQSIWAFLSEAALLGPDEARRAFLQVGRDPRPVMRAAYDCFKDGGEPSKVGVGVGGSVVLVLMQQSSS